MRLIPCCSVLRASSRNSHNIAHEPNNQVVAKHRDDARQENWTIWNCSLTAQCLVGKAPARHQNWDQSRFLSGVIDPKRLVHLQPFHGDRTRLFGCTRSFTVAARAVNRNTHDKLQTVEDNVTQDSPHSRLSNEQEDISEQLRTRPARLCKATACIRSAEDGNGLHGKLS